MGVDSPPPLRHVAVARGRTGRKASQRVLLGSLLGLTWSAALRGWMTQLRGPDSEYTWSGTFLGLLLPGATVGALLGWAEHLQRIGEGRRAQRLVLAPLLFPAAALSLPGAVRQLRTSGQGSGAIGMVLLAMPAGYSLSGRGPVWRRVACGVTGFAVIPAAYLGPPMRPELAPGTPLGAWAATAFSSLFGTLALACAIPMRRASGGDADPTGPQEQARTVPV